MQTTKSPKAGERTHTKSGSQELTIDTAPKHSPNIGVFEMFDGDQRASWTASGKGTATIKASASRTEQWLELQASETPENGRTRQVFVTLNKESATALRDFLNEML